MSTRFTKMHGLGNDFVILDARDQAIDLSPRRVRQLADRRLGIGCDQLIRLEPSARADLFMRIWNPDGSEAMACGNATRCVARLTGVSTVETGGGLVRVLPSDEGIAVDMGPPRFGWQEVPLAYPMDTDALPVGWGMLERPVALSVGNPHIVFFVDDADAIDLGRLGPEIAADPLFPEGVNVNVAHVESAGHVRLNVWERGAGLTAACGSGACATFAAGRRRGLVPAQAEIHLPGGDLRLSERSGRLVMEGPATLSFEGVVEIERPQP